MTHDPRGIRKTIWKGRAFNAPALIVLALVFAGSYFMFLREFAYQNADLYIHAMIAHDFDFTDLHSITSRLSYPVWHIVVSALYQLGVPLGPCCCGRVRAVQGGHLPADLLAGGRHGGRAGQPRGSAGAERVSDDRDGRAGHVRVRRSISRRWVAQCVAQPHPADRDRRHDAGDAVACALLVRVCKAGGGRKAARASALVEDCGAGGFVHGQRGLQAHVHAGAAARLRFVMYLVEVFRHKKEWRYFGQIVLAFCRRWAISC